MCLVTDPSKPTLRLNLPRLKAFAGPEASWNDLADRIGTTGATLSRTSSGATAPSGSFVAAVLVAFPEAKFEELFDVAA